MNPTSSVLRNPIGTDVSSSFPEGSLPSITAATSLLQQHHDSDTLPESILNDIMEVGRGRWSKLSDII